MHDMLKALCPGNLKVCFKNEIQHISLNKRKALRMLNTTVQKWEDDKCLTTVMKFLYRTTFKKPYQNSSFFKSDKTCKWNYMSVLHSNR